MTLAHGPDDGTEYSLDVKRSRGKRTNNARTAFVPLDGSVVSKEFVDVFPPIAGVQSS
jgi:hypothetical protein